MPATIRWLALIALAVGFSAVAPSVVAAGSPERACNSIEIFHRPGCPHCARALAFVRQLHQELPSLQVQIHDVASSRDSARRFMLLNERFGIERPGVPAILICDDFLVGFSREQTPKDVRTLLSGGRVEPLEPTESPSVTLPLFGPVALSQVGLPIFTIAIGLVDGFNPCAMWVLLFLLSLLVNLRDRTRMIIIASTFVIVSGAVYFAFMAAWMNLFLVLGVSRALQIAIGVAALVIGIIHLKDFFAAGRGPSLSIPDAVKPGIYARVRAIVQAENLPAALVLVVLLAIGVNMVELLCTAGLPALYTRILTLQPMSSAAYYAYLLLYNLAYIVDDALMVAIVVYSLQRAKLRPEQGRWLKLVSGLVVSALGAMLLLTPGALL